MEENKPVKPRVKKEKVDIDVIRESLIEVGDGEFKRLVGMFAKWSNDDTKIARFMQNLDPLKIYTRNELKTYALSVGIKEIIHLTKNIVGKTNGYGMIIKRNNDDTYRLHPCLVEEFNKHF